MYTGAGVGIPRTTAYRYIVEMDGRGMIRYDGASRTIRTPLIDKFAPDSALCPLVGSIPCGSAQTEEENVREYISLPVSLFGKGQFYILEASGDSMIDAGIDNGDLVVIQKDCNAKAGDIVVALTEENENTLKIFGGVDQVTDQYSHILDDDRRNNAQLFENAFYSGKGADSIEPQAEPVNKAPAAAPGVDPALLAKVLSNPEMAALLTTLAKSLN